MKKRAFFEWLKGQNCDVVPKHGINQTASLLEIVNSKTGRYSYFAFPTSDDFIPRKSIEKLIGDLGIEPPKDF